MSKSRDRRKHERTEEMPAPRAATPPPKPAAGARGLPAGTQLISRTTETITHRHTGPLPAPAILQHYEELLPGLADRIVTMAEREQDSRLQGNRVLVGEHVRSRKWGQVSGVLLSGAALAVAAFFGHLGYPTAGASIAVAVIGALGTLMYVKQANARREAKATPAADEDPQLGLPL